MRFIVKGDWGKTFRYLRKMQSADWTRIIERYARLGVELLASSTPSRSGKTAESWSYEIKMGDGHTTINWNNSNVNDGVNIALILQYGHGTGYGGYVQGVDYINPAIQSAFVKMVEEIWEEVRKT